MQELLELLKSYQDEIAEHNEEEYPCEYACGRASALMDVVEDLTQLLDGEEI